MLPPHRHLSSRARDFVLAKYARIFTRIVSHKYRSSAIPIDVQSIAIDLSSPAYDIPDWLFSSLRSFVSSCASLAKRMCRGFLKMWGEGYKLQPKILKRKNVESIFFFRQTFLIFWCETHVIVYIFACTIPGIIYRISRINSRVSSIYAGPLSCVIRAVGSDSRHRYALIPFSLYVAKFSGTTRKNIIYIPFYISQVFLKLIS